MSGSAQNLNLPVIWQCLASYSCLTVVQSGACHPTPSSYLLTENWQSLTLASQIFTLQEQTFIKQGIDSIQVVWLSWLVYIEQIENGHKQMPTVEASFLSWQSLGYISTPV